ncbi:MAG: carbohydrate porin [Planctomycetia bacterium]|nr:carbohydrate porin [Planctomycetia bacterium]
MSERSKLAGDWGGRRADLRAGGVTLDVSTTQFYQGVATGGLEQAFQYGGRNDYFLNVDGEKVGLWSGLAVTLHAETRYGESVNSIAGTLMAPNLMSAFPLPSGTVTALTNVTFTQSFSEAFQVFAGKLNTMDGSEQPLTGADNFNGFQNIAMLYNPVFARTVPYSTFGAGFAYLKDDESVFSVTVYDTNDTTTVGGFNTFLDNGVTIYAELNASTNFFDLPGHQGISGTYSTGTYTDLTPTAYLDPIAGLIVASAPRTGSWCSAYNFDQAFYVSPEDPNQMWGLFGNFGIADDNPSPARWLASAGLSGTGGIAGRKGDSFGFAYFYLGVSDSLKNLAPLLLPLRDEHGIELYYNVALTPWCRITPDLQTITPFRDRAETALLVGLRARIDF